MIEPDDRSPQRFEDVALRAIVEGVEAETGDQFFASLVRHLSSALRVEYAFVSELSSDRQAFRTLALWARGALRDNITVALAGSPCEAVLNGEMSHHPEHLQALFPRDAALADWGAESYCGVPLVDRSGVVTGHLAIMDDEPMRDGPRGLSVLRIFAARARAEIERLRAEAAVRDSEARHRDLYEEAPVAYYSVGVDGRIRRWNRKFVELLGYAPDELAGRPISTLWTDTPAGRPRGERALERFRAGEELHDEEIELRRKDGAPVWVRLSVRPLRDAQGRVEATRSTLMDVTELKRAEEARRSSEERLARVLASAMDAIVTIDASRRVEIWNEAAAAVFGCAAADAIGQLFDRFLTDGLRRSLESAMQAFAADAQARPYVHAPGGLRALDAAGRESPIEGTISHVEVLDMHPSTLRSRMQKLGIRRSEELS